jgi:uncharacterized protein YdcH (DUF465 family)
MGNLNDPLKKELFETDEEFRTLFEEHQKFEQRLEELHEKSLLSEEDELEEKQIKRQKLLLKDRMAIILKMRRETGVSA